MQYSRDELIHQDKALPHWKDLPLQNLHNISKQALESCIMAYPFFAKRFNKMKSTSELDRRNERDWLVDLVSAHFVRKWNNKRNADIKIREVSKKRKADVSCATCGNCLQ